MKRILKISGIIIGILLLLFLGAYIWVIYNAQYLLREFVRSESKGKIEIASQKVRYSFRRQQFEVFNPRISSAPSADQSTSYVIRLKKMVLNTGSLQSILFRKTFTIDSLDCTQPVVEVIKTKPSENKKVSLPEEISKIYKSIEEVISKMEIRHFAISNGSFSLIRKYDPESPPIHISNIDLTITNFGEFSDNDASKRVLFTDRILLESRNQDIIFPDGLHGLRFSRFRLNSETRHIEIDSCYIYGNNTKNSTADFGVFVDTLRLINTDLNALSRADIIRVDSTVCLNPEIRFNLEVKNTSNGSVFSSKKREKDSLEAAFKNLFANLDLRAINVLNAGINIRVKRGEGVTTYTSKKSNFNLMGLLILKDPAVPIQVERFDFAIRDYRGFSRDSAYMIRFDSIQLLKNRLSLSNFVIAPNSSNHNADWREVKTKAFQLEDITWAELIYNNRVFAERAILVRPEVEIHSQTRRKKQRGSLYRALDGFKDNFEINQLILSDAKVIIESGDGTVLEMDDFNTGIKANALLNADDAGELINSIDRFSFGNGFLRNKGREFRLSEGIYNGKDQSIFLKSATYTGNEPGNSISAEFINLKNIERRSPFQFTADSVSWEKAGITLNYRKKQDNLSPAFESFVAEWSNTNGRNTSVDIKGDALEMKTFLSVITTGEVKITDDGMPEISRLSVKGDQLQFNNELITANAGSYFLNDKQVSILEKVQLNIKGNHQNISGYFPKIQVISDLASILDKKNRISQLMIFQPTIQIRDTITVLDSTSSNSKIPFADIEQLELIEPNIMLPSNSVYRDIKISSLKMNEVKSDGNIISAKKILAHSPGLQINTDRVQISSIPDKQQLFNLKDVSYQKDDGKKPAVWHATVNEAVLPGINVLIKSDSGKNKNISVTDLAVRNLAIGNNRQMTLPKILIQNPELNFYASNLDYSDGEDRIVSRGVQLNSTTDYFEADSISWRPVISADSFMQMQTVRRNYISFTSGKVQIEKFDLQTRGNDSIVHGGFMKMQNPTLYIYKDMHLPFEAGYIKPLATGMIKQIPFPVSADSVRLYNGLVTYEEINDKTHRTGIVRFANTQATFYNFHNLEKEQENDSLTFIASSRFLDTVNLHLTYKESYYDPVHGFKMNLKIGAFGLPALNTILEPLASARVDRGSLDTLRMVVIGDDEVARGKMQMYYRHLHVSYLNKKDNSRKTVVTRLVNFAANNILLRGKNMRKTGTVYWDRIRDKSIFNYWMKIVISGALNSVGIEGVNKQDRKNHREVRKMDFGKF